MKDNGVKEDQEQSNRAEIKGSENGGWNKREKRRKVLKLIKMMDNCTSTGSAALWYSIRVCGTKWADKTKRKKQGQLCEGVVGGESGNRRGGVSSCSGRSPKGTVLWGKGNYILNYYWHVNPFSTVHQRHPRFPKPAPPPSQHSISLPLSLLLSFCFYSFSTPRLLPSPYCTARPATKRTREEATHCTPHCTTTWIFNRRNIDSRLLLRPSEIKTSTFFKTRYSIYSIIISVVQNWNPFLFLKKSMLIAFPPRHFISITFLWHSTTKHHISNTVFFLEWHKFVNV